MALVKMVEKALQKNNGGSVEFRLAALEKQIEDMKSKLHDFQRGFFEFREEARIRWAKGDADE